MFFLIGGIFLKFWGQLGANVFVEFENVFFHKGQLGANGGNWGQMC